MSFSLLKAFRRLNKSFLLTLERTLEMNAITASVMSGSVKVFRYSISEAIPIFFNRFEVITLTLIIPDVTKTSSNNCF